MCKHFLQKALVPAAAATLLLSGGLASRSAMAQAVGGYSYSSCYAATVCPNGVSISCQVYGNATTYTACNWWVVPGYSVECNGYGYVGPWLQWINLYYKCY